MQKRKKTRTELSIIILSYNTSNLLKKCLASIEKVHDEVNFEIIVIDNASSDDSLEMVRKKFPRVKLVTNKTNLGFARGNNVARYIATGKYILFLNSDAMVKKYTLGKSILYMNKNKNVGAMTCKIILPNGALDKDARRSFITPWIGLTHLFLKLDRIFPKSKLFSKYWYGYIDSNTTHEVDALQGAFFLTRKEVLDEVNWFSEDYFLDGEDIDLSWKIKNKGYKIVYYPKAAIVHYKGSSKGKIESNTKKNINLKEKLRFRLSGVNSMQVFYKKHLWEKYPLILNIIVLIGIYLIKVIRFTRTLILG